MTRLPSGNNRNPASGLQLIRHTQAIIRLSGEGNYCWVHYATGRPNSLICRTLKDIADRLPLFLRVNKQNLINPAFIDHLLVVVPRLKEYVVLTNGSQISVARRRVRAIQAALPACPRIERPADLVL